ncbi:cytochrome c oxidase cbb3-type subunit 3 [Pseudorhizobium tarimense]|uniref:Cbb3-type cytochrome c oxidase subunit n=1 Tax=Pseudorhizobium tarimense TaxID=1079109 RepID=A0ABV2H341_9HYPH|nr:cytochrome-c oxidase, cbb3-type subunit III [Pseudorhizobium tarimense]MCJ8518046.1 cytochrome-c oxidase, cbb3-type subunit III [Pseudorhizobium tarimense]
MADKHIDEISGVETTGHEWDGIRELNNPMPRWWVWTFYATIIWAIGYTVLFPAWPLVNEATRGVLNYSSRGDLAGEMEGARSAQGEILEKISKVSLEEILSDPQLAQFATAGGASAFRVNCVQCHGTGATGGQGYPNLNDDEWLWGGDVNAIYATIAYGVRDRVDPDTRYSEMPAFGDILQPEEVRQVAAYVVSLSGTPRDPSMVGPGQQVFADNCASCHGENAEGNRDVGAPNLADAIWLKVSAENQIVQQIQSPRHGVMPAWSARLSNEIVKQLAVYVHSLGGGD